MERKRWITDEPLPDCPPVGRSAPGLMVGFTGFGGVSMIPSINDHALSRGGDRRGIPGSAAPVQAVRVRNHFACLRSGACAGQS